jgi:hypothetical protein
MMKQLDPTPQETFATDDHVNVIAAVNATPGAV